jgi:SAM-dependent methyltransferase
VSASRVCPGCHGADARTTGTVNGFEVRSCDTCGTLFTARLPTAESAQDYDAFYGESRDVAVPEFVLHRLEQHVAGLAAYRSGLNRWLDIGCGAGTLLQAAVNQGWQALGTEVAAPAVEAVRSAGLDAVVGTTRELDLPPDGYDVVSMIEVVEHVEDPDELLADAARLVRPGGAVYLTTPHGRSLSARVLGTKWAVVEPPEHLQLFSRAGLQAALERAGLRVRSVVTHGINPYDLKAAFRSGRAGDSPRRNTESSYQLNEALSTRRSGTLVKATINAALSGTRLGDTLKVVAEKPAA